MSGVISLKAKIVKVFLVFLLGISINGCSCNFNKNSSSDKSVPVVLSSSSFNRSGENIKAQVTSNDLVLEAYKAVLQNKAEFFSTDSKKKLYLNDFLTNKEIYGTAFTVAHFTVLDMNGDKVPEVILELSVGKEPQFYEVLHYTNNTVYGYFIVYRGLEKLKADGTFHYSSSAADTGIGKLKFGPDSYTTDILGYSESGQGGVLSYFIKDKPVTKKSFDSFINEQSEKKDAVWYEFSQKNIETKLIVSS